MAEDIVFVLVVGEKVFRKDTQFFFIPHPLAIHAYKELNYDGRNCFWTIIKIDLFPPKFMRHASTHKFYIH